jgi:hypothetical protein
MEYVGRMLRKMSEHCFLDKDFALQYFWSDFDCT